MKRILFGGVIAIVFAAIVTDEVRLHQVVQRQSGALKRLTAEVSDLQRTTADQGKKLSVSRNFALVPNVGNSPPNGAATLFNVVPRKGGVPGAAPFANDLLEDRPSRVPPGWEPFEFNGQTYYRIPLANASPEPLGFRP